MGREDEIAQLKKDISPRNLAQLFDHTNLYPAASKKDIAKLCDEAREYEFASVCILPTRVAYAVEQLKGSGIAVCTVVGFPLGASYTEAKVLESQIAIIQGTSEIDMVVNNGLLADNNIEHFVYDISEVAKAVRDSGAKTLKCIIEAGYLNAEKVRIATEYITQVAQEFLELHVFAKTSTGMELDSLLCEKYDGKKKGARREDLEIMSASGIPIKISGGVRTYDDAINMLYSAGLRSREDINPQKYRIGSSASVNIVTS